MQIKHTLCLDFETAYDTAEKYSLSKMTAEEYINDPRFQVIMVSVKVDAAPAQWKDAADPDFETWLRAFPWEESAAVAHNGSFFDFLILGWVYGIYPKFYICTLLLARPLAGERESSSLAKLAEKFGLPSKGTAIVMANGKRRADFTPSELREYGEYCAHDTDLCYDILLHLLAHWAPVDLAWMHITCRMAARPIIDLDSAVLAEGLRGEAEKEGRALELLAEQMQLSQIRLPTDKKGAPLDLKKIVGSSEMFADLLRKFRQEPPMKYSEKQKKWVYAFAKTDDFVRETAEDGSELPGVTEAVHARLGVKSTIMSSRLLRMEGIAERMGTLPVPIRPFGAHTGRCSGCLVADTKITVYTPHVGVSEKLITDVLDTDLVWDGEEFVAHEGVVFSGYREVITHDGVTGTPDHVVFTADGEVPLAEAKARGAHITDASFYGAGRRAFRP